MGFTCNQPGTVDCLFMGIIYFMLLMPLELLFRAFGLTFEWSLTRFPELYDGMP